MKVKYGVPQGSMLEPLFILFYQFVKGQGYLSLIFLHMAKIPFPPFVIL